MEKLNGKVAVVTGGSSGIGEAIATRFVDEGAYVFIAGRRQAELDRVKARIGRNVTAIKADVTSQPDLDELFSTVKGERGWLDIIVTSAGMFEQRMLDGASHEHFDELFNLNVRGTFFTVRTGLPLLRDNGAIVLVSAGLHLKGIPALSVYAATKAAVRSFSRSWASELSGRGIRVNTLSPGATHTPSMDSQAKSPEEASKLRAMYAGMTPLNRIGSPEEIASAAFFLASDESSFTTGFDLVADGGITQL